MMRPVAVIWLIALVGVAAGVYLVKYRASELRGELKEVRSDIRSERERLRVLRAEWTYLTRPERLAREARERLDMRPVTPGQIVEPDALPPRVTARRFEPARETVELAGDSGDKKQAVALPHIKPWSLTAQVARAPQPGGGRP